MNGAIGSLVKILSMGEFNSLVSLMFVVVVCHIFLMIIFQITDGGVVVGGLGYIAPVPISPSTALVSLVNGVEPSTPVLMTIQGFLFNPTLNAVVITMTSSIVGNLSDFGACATPELMVKSG